jgi:hypothetical protein
MPNIRETNISNSFAASLSFVGEEKVAEYSLDKEDTLIEKYAGMDIYQPTVDNVENFVRKYTMNELAFFPKALEIHTLLNPTSFDTANKDYVSEASGVVSIKLHDAKIELPFIISESELVPFDVIQLNGQRVPYSRENIRKVLIGVDKTFTDKVNGVHGTVGGEFQPYLKTENPANPATSAGFLGNVLQIQDQHIRRNGSDIYIHASQKLDEGLEKLAAMKELTMKEINTLENEFKKQASVEFKSELDKYAKEIEEYDDSTALKLFRNLDELKFDNANSLPNGTAISFPERCGKEMQMTKGVVVDNFMELNGAKSQVKKIVITSDGRVKILDNNEKFLCFKDNAKFSLPTKSLGSVEEGDVIVAFNGDKALAPAEIKYINERGIGFDYKKSAGDFNTKIIEAKFVGNGDMLGNALGSDVKSPEPKNHRPMNSMDDSHYGYFKIVPMQGAKFTEVNYRDYVNHLAEKTQSDPIKISATLPEYSVGVKNNKVLCADFDDVKVVPVKGTITNYMRVKEDLRNLVETTGEFTMKTAADAESVYVKCIDPQRGMFFVQIKYIDKSKTMFNQMTKEYRDLPEAGLKQVLKVLGFDGGQTAEILHRSKEMGNVTMPLPETAKVDMLTGANVVNRSTAQVKNVVGKLVSPQAVGDAVMSSLLGAMLTGAIASRGAVPQGGDSAREALKFAKKFASESEALSVAFEKVAYEKKSESMLEVAKLMSSSALLNEKIASMLQGKCYPRIVETAFDIVQGKDELERVAYELMGLKYDQYTSKDQIVNPNYIQGAVNQIDSLYKMAYALVSTSPAYMEKLAALTDKEKEEASHIPGTSYWEEAEERKEQAEAKKDDAADGQHPDTEDQKQEEHDEDNKDKENDEKTASAEGRLLGTALGSAALGIALPVGVIAGGVHLGHILNEKHDEKKRKKQEKTASLAERIADRKITLLDEPSPVSFGDGDSADVTLKITGTGLDGELLDGHDIVNSTIKLLLIFY